MALQVLLYTGLVSCDLYAVANAILLELNPSKVEILQDVSSVQMHHELKNCRTSSQCVTQGSTFTILIILRY